MLRSQWDLIFVSTHVCNSFAPVWAQRARRVIKWGWAQLLLTTFFSQQVLRVQSLDCVIESLDTWLRLKCRYLIHHVTLTKWVWVSTDLSWKWKELNTLFQPPRTMAALLTVGSEYLLRGGYSTKLLTKLNGKYKINSNSGKHRTQ